MNFTEQDRLIHKGGRNLVDAQLRVQSLTHNLLKDMTKEQLLEIVKNVNSEAFYCQSGEKNVERFMTEFEMEVDLILSED